MKKLTQQGVNLNQANWHFSRRRLLSASLAGSAGLAMSPFSRASALGLESQNNANRSPRKRIGVALVGLGYYSTDILAPAFKFAEHCELRGIVTGSPQKIPFWKQQYGIPDTHIYSYEQMHKVANNPDIDVMYIVLPTFLHKKYSVIAANAGKHVWCEKPMAMSVEECQSIIDACANNNVKLSIGYRMQHEPNTQTLMSFAGSKPYGPMRDIISEAGYAGQGFAPDSWKMHTSKGGGSSYDMGVYPINAARYATGLNPIAVTARYSNPMPQTFKHTDPACHFELEFAGNLIAKCHTSTIEFVNHLRVNCDKGWYELQPMQTYSGVRGRTSDGIALDLPIKNQQAKQMDNDALAILNNTQVLVPGVDGLEDIRVVTAIHQSALNNGQRVLIRR